MSLPPSRLVWFVLTAGLALAGLLETPPRATAPPAFPPGNLGVGPGRDAGNPLHNPAPSVGRLEYPPTGTLVQTVTLPSAAGDANRFTLSGTATTEGAVTVAANGLSFTLGGYRAAVFDTNPNASTSSAVPRV